MGLSRALDRRGVTNHKEIIELVVDQLFPALKRKDFATSEKAMRDIAIELMLNGHVVVANAHSQLWDHTTKYIKITPCSHAEGAYTHTLDKKFYTSKHFRDVIELSVGVLKAQIKEVTKKMQNISGLDSIIHNHYDAI